MLRLLFYCQSSPLFAYIAYCRSKQLANNDFSVDAVSDRELKLDPAQVAVLKGMNVDPNQLPFPETNLDNLHTFDVVVTIDTSDVEPLKALPTFPLSIHWKLPDLKVSGVSNRDKQTNLKRIRDEIISLTDALFKPGYLNALVKNRMTWGALIDNLTDGVMAHDLERRIFVFNSAAAEITGYNASEVLGRDCHEVFPGFFCGGDCSFCTGDKEHKSRLHYPRLFKRQDGSKRELDMSVVTLTTPQDEILGALVIFRDMTEYHHLKQKLDDTRGFHGIVGRHQSMLKVFESIREMADINVSTLVQGESGTGKEMVATALHNRSSRASGPFVTVNCGALPEGTLESELFGHVRGAFTGAIRDKKGRFELADEGTIFLDEIGEISMGMQVKLLRVLQDMTFTPVGGESNVTVNVRVICATNKNLKELVNKGLFREDLYYRLAVVPITMPPLRDKREDIPLLVDHFLEKYSGGNGSNVKQIAPEVYDLFSIYNWPGNVRELANAIQYAQIKCHNDQINIEHLPPEIRDVYVGSTKSGRPSRLTEEAVNEALKKTAGNKARAAELLNVSRQTLYTFLRQNSVQLDTSVKK